MNKPTLVTIMRADVTKRGAGNGLSGVTSNGSRVFIPESLVKDYKQGEVHYAIVNTTTQTKTYNAAGELVDLPADQQRDFTQATAISTDRAKIMKAYNADRLLLIEAEAEVAKEASTIAESYKQYGYTAEKLMELIG